MSELRLGVLRCDRCGEPFSLTNLHVCCGKGDAEAIESHPANMTESEMITELRQMCAEYREELTALRKLVRKAGEALEPFADGFEDYDYYCDPLRYEDWGRAAEVLHQIKEQMGGTE